MSAIDNGQPQPSTSAAGAPAPIRKRRFSSAKIQPTRIKKVMQSDEDIGRMVASVPVAIGSAMEHFLEKLLTSAAHCIQFSASRTLSPSHIKQAVLMNPHFKFLENSLADVPALPKVDASAIPPLIPEPQVPVDTSNTYSNMLATLINATTRAGVSPGVNCLPQANMFLNPSALTQQVLAQIAVASGAEKRKAAAPVSAADPSKPKRGRPRKIKKEDKCVDETDLVLPTTAEESKPKVSTPLTDRELMPPPKLPIVFRKVTNSESGAIKKEKVTINGCAKVDGCGENNAKREPKAEPEVCMAKAEATPEEASSS
uniref:CBFD_NFYB_HMF domain-containing protein n=1 Tax=Steinernema glaseri TaxID=37863 RepID=A0A1I7YZ06_9BILA